MEDLSPCIPGGDLLHFLISRYYSGMGVGGETVRKRGIGRERETEIESNTDYWLLSYANKPPSGIFCDWIAVIE